MNIRLKTIKQIDENFIGNVCNIGLGNDFFLLKTKAIYIMQKHYIYINYISVYIYIYTYIMKP